METSHYVKDDNYRICQSLIEVESMINTLLERMLKKWNNCSEWASLKFDEELIFSRNVISDLSKIIAEIDKNDAWFLLGRLSASISTFDKHYRKCEKKGNIHYSTILCDLENVSKGTGGLYAYLCTKLIRMNFDEKSLQKPFELPPLLYGYKPQVENVSVRDASKVNLLTVNYN